jgi:CPA1 family monovalent cation:H+ antiporter
LLEGESLLNDGTAIIFFTLSIGLVTGAAVTVGSLAIDFLFFVIEHLLMGI